MPDRLADGIAIGKRYALAHDHALPRRDLPTPALLIDRAALERNIAAMAAFAEAQGITLRPHAKTHKSGEIARRQIAAGAAGSAAPSSARPRCWPRTAWGISISPRRW
ncbi:hypothetical protein PIB19_14590 [Sphingomonas sp. 7/4-4]|uniref:hypothetical protein n=1 Tax=Sphingomonas sp. 7/4-4 TaxID=3018446 RepID=UPI0022F3C9BB|nr:hypothetical protein [Sphingomonas sp. 7/4-4]WBY06748.1 hypothetical protein PIB19_14590 [Sphingomonas sp. 7/4-4]